MPRTRVVNLHRRETFDVYIGRAGRGLDGEFGNPIGLEGRTRKEVLAQYKEYFFRRLEQDKGFRDRIESLRGKSLGCFCAPSECHGMVIVEYLEGIPVEQQIKDYEESTGVRRKKEKEPLPQCFD